MLTELYLDDNNFEGMFTHTLVDRLYDDIIESTSLPIYFLLWVPFNRKYKIIKFSRVYKETKGFRQF
jgi:hypothetical protein